MFFILINNGRKVKIVEIDDENEIFNINSKEQLEEANRIIMNRIIFPNQRMMLNRMILVVQLVVVLVEVQGV